MTNSHPCLRPVGPTRPNTARMQGWVRSSRISKVQPKHRISGKSRQIPCATNFSLFDMLLMDTLIQSICMTPCRLGKSSPNHRIRRHYIDQWLCVSFPCISQTHFTLWNTRQGDEYLRTSAARLFRPPTSPPELRSSSTACRMSAGPLSVVQATPTPAAFDHFEPQANVQVKQYRTV